MTIGRSQRIVRSQAVSREFAWHVHTALEAWTARADLKASILLAFQGGGFVFAVSSRDLLPAVEPRVGIGLVVGSLGTLLLAMAMAGWTLRPVLGSSRRHRREHESAFVYFGHLRWWRQSDLADRLAQLTPRDETNMLAAQLIAQSRLVWHKHRLLQLSVVLTMLAGLTMAAAVGASAFRR